MTDFHDVAVEPPKPAAEPRRTSDALRRVDLATILRGDREVIIQHGRDEYRLRLTSNDRLLLTK